MIAASSGVDLYVSGSAVCQSKPGNFTHDAAIAGKVPRKMWIPKQSRFPQNCKRVSDARHVLQKSNGCACLMPSLEPRAKELNGIRSVDACACRKMGKRSLM